MTHNEKVLALLSDGEPHTHHELYALHVIGHSRIADLRKQGYVIDRWTEEGPDGQTDYIYRLLVAASPSNPGGTAASLPARAHRSERDVGELAVSSSAQASGELERLAAPSTRAGETVSRSAHNAETPGSTPGPAIQLDLFRDQVVAA